MPHRCGPTTEDPTEAAGSRSIREDGLEALESLPLPDVRDDRLDVAVVGSFHRRHVTESPVVLPDPALNRDNECHVAVVARFVDLREVGRADVGAAEVCAVAAQVAR